MVRTLILIITITLAFGSTQLLAAGSTLLSVQAVVLSKSKCRFTTTTATIPFGNLDPSSPVDVNQTLSINIRCGGSAPIATFLISDDDGLFESGPDGNRMQHLVQPTFFMPYSLTASPLSGTTPRNTDVAITITADILAASYATLPAGDYSDTVTLSIIP